MKKANSQRAWQIKVNLDGTWPPVWRRILVSDKMHLEALHDVIQAAFGWDDYHLHEFAVYGVRYGDPANDEFGEYDLQDELDTKLRKLGLAQGECFTYVYDFGDNWQHTLQLEKILPIQKGSRIPRCLAGKRACPPEDVGGIGGYARFLEAIDDSGHPEHRSLLRWIGGAFDPEAFDLKAANERMAERARAKPAAGWMLPADGEGTASGAIFDASVWRTPVSAEHEMTARDLALRRDIQTILCYIRDHKVTGTQSTGNLPLKVVAELSHAFVNPPTLETRIGEKVFRFRSEEEVWPVFFAHKLANGAGLLEGGPGRRWRLTPRGEKFLSEAAVTQVLTLLHAWWHRVDWMIAVRIDIFGDTLSPAVPQIVLSLLRDFRIKQSVQFEAFIDQLIEGVGWTWTKLEPDNTRSLIRSAVDRMLVDPLAELGVISTVRLKDRESLFKWTKLVSFSLTGFGQMLLEGLLF